MYILKTEGFLHLDRLTWFTLPPACACRSRSPWLSARPWRGSHRSRASRSGARGRAEQRLPRVPLYASLSPRSPPSPSSGSPQPCSRTREGHAEWSTSSPLRTGVGRIRGRPPNGHGIHARRNGPMDRLPPGRSSRGRMGKMRIFNLVKPAFVD